MEAVLDRFLNPAIAFPLVLLVSHLIYIRLNAKPDVPPELPWIGRDPSKWFSKTRASLASFSNVRQWLNEGYEKVPF